MENPMIRNLIGLLKTTDSDDHLFQLLKILLVHAHSLADKDAIFYTLFQYILDIIIKFHDKFNMQTILNCFELLNNLLDNRQKNYFILPGISLFSLQILKIIQNESQKYIIQESIKLFTRIILMNRTENVDSHIYSNNSNTNSDQNGNNDNLKLFDCCKKNETNNSTSINHDNDEKLIQVLRLISCLENEINRDILCQFATNIISFFQDNIKAIKILLKLGPSFIDPDLATSFLDQSFFKDEEKSLFIKFVPIEAILARLDKLSPSSLSNISYNSDYELEIVQWMIRKNEWIKAALYAQSPMVLDFVMTNVLTNFIDRKDKSKEFKRLDGNNSNERVEEGKKLLSQLASILWKKNCKSKERLILYLEEKDFSPHLHSISQKNLEIIEFLKSELEDRLSHPLLYSSSKQTIRAIELLKKYDSATFSIDSLFDSKIIRWDQINDESLIFELLSLSNHCHHDTLPIHFVSHDNSRIREMALDLLSFTSEQIVYKSWPFLLSRLSDENLTVRDKAFNSISRIFAKYPEFISGKASQLPLNNLLIRPAVLNCYIEMIKNVKLKHGFIRKLLENLIEPLMERDIGNINIKDCNHDHDRQSCNNSHHVNAVNARHEEHELFFKLLHSLDLNYGDHTWYYLNYLCHANNKSIINALYNK